MKYIVFEFGGKKYEGWLLPKTEFSGDVVVIKLKNGYNVGFDPSSIRILEERQVKEKEPPTLKIKQRPENPKISLISTGGTIASKVEYETGAVYPALTPEDILACIPEMLDFVYIKEFFLFSQILSEDMTPTIWKALAKEVGKRIEDELKGIVITHGTDTMHFTAAALSFMLRNLKKPIVLTGAQRSSDRPSTDASMNLLCSSYLAGYSDIAEVGICMHGSISDDYCLFHRGTKVRKMHTSRRDTFKSINDRPLAKIFPKGRIEIINENYERGGKGDFYVDAVFEEKVALIKAYPGADPEIFDFFVDRGYKGIVVEATGMGHVPTNEPAKSWLPQIKRAIEEGVVVAFAPQTLYGRLNPYVYKNARKMLEIGVLYLEDMLPETAYVKLGWVLGHDLDIDEVKAWMLKNFAHEINERHTLDLFP